MVRRCSPRRRRLLCRLAGLAGALVILAAASGPARALQAHVPGQPSGYYDYAEASAAIVVGKVVAVDKQALQAEVTEVLKGSVPEKMLSISPSQISDCLGKFPVLQSGEQGAFFLKTLEKGQGVLVVEGAVLNMRYAGADTVPAVRRLMEIAALPQKEARERAVVDLLDAKNRVLFEAGRAFVTVHVLFDKRADAFAGQLVTKLSSPNPEVRIVVARALGGAQGREAVQGLVYCTEDTFTSRRVASHSDCRAKGSAASN